MDVMADAEKTSQSVLPIATSSSSVHAPKDQSSSPTLVDRLLRHLGTDVDLELSSWPMMAYCFMTGYIDSVSFTACFIWCAFQTGNTIQLGLAIARLFSGPIHDTALRTPDKQALISLCAFLIGATFARPANLESRFFNNRRRGWLALATFFQALLSMGGCLAARASTTGSIADSRGDPVWTDAPGLVALAMISASMGLQAAIGNRLGSHFATSVVLTTIWIQIMGDKQLLRPDRRVAARDRRILAVLFLFVGGIAGRALINTIGASSTIAIGAGIRVLISIGWLFVPDAKPKE